MRGGVAGGEEEAVVGGEGRVVADGGAGRVGVAGGEAVRRGVRGHEADDAAGAAGAADDSAGLLGVGALARPARRSRAAFVR